MRNFWALPALLGSVALAITGLFAVFFVSDLASAQDFAAARKVFANWQTLLAGLLALVGAGFAALMVMHQIEADREVEKARRANRARALWATAPHMMANVLHYAELLGERQIEFLVISAEREGRLSRLWHDSQRKKFEPLESVQEWIENLVEAGNSSEATALTEISHLLQTMTSITNEITDVCNGYYGNSSYGMSYPFYALRETVTLAAYCHVVFEAHHERRRDIRISLSRDGILNAWNLHFRHMVADRHLHDQIVAYLTEPYGRAAK